MLLFLTFDFSKAKITDGDTPPAPIIRAFLFSTLFISFLSFGAITFWKGIILIILLLFFVLQAIFSHKESPEGFKSSELDEETSAMGVFMLGAFLTIGFIGLPLGAHIVIKSATRFALSIGVSNEIIGLTVVAIGTSLPELATSVAAAYRKEVNLLLGNVIGSNMFNILGIAGAAALIAPLRLTNETEFTSLTVLLISGIILAPFIILKKAITRFIGTIFICVTPIIIIFRI